MSAIKFLNLVMNKSICRQIFLRFQQQLPLPTTELIYNSDFELLIAVILSAQATDVSVNLATTRLYKVANTADALLALGVEGLIPYIKSIGLYKTKAKNIIATCQILIEKYASQVPRTRIELEALPGVGRKTANVILNTCFNEPTIAVDTHIFRVSNRIGIAKAKTPLGVELQLEKIIPQEFLISAHHWLILHGRYTCTARKPQCNVCLIKDLCEYPSKNI